MRKKIKISCIIPSSAKTISKNKISEYEFIDKKPEVGDVVYGSVLKLGQYSQIENKNGRLHTIVEGVRSLFVFGNRYAPDYYEAFVPDSFSSEVDMVARSGVIGKVKTKNEKIKEPTIIKILGYLVDKNGEVVNTKNFNTIIPHEKNKNKNQIRSKLILSIGTSMNSGKSLSAAACCSVLSSAGNNVRFSKVTGTASLKDILNAQDRGAEVVNDFTFLGYPSTYMLDEQELLYIFNSIDLKYANNPKNYWVVEFSDGISQRETSILLNNETIKKRIYRLIFSADSVFSAIGGISVLKEKYGLVPNVISGVCSRSPLFIRELEEFIDIPVVNNINPNFKEFLEILK
jgi:hypothetical protein